MNQFPAHPPLSPPHHVRQQGKNHLEDLPGSLTWPALLFSSDLRLISANLDAQELLGLGTDDTGQTMLGQILHDSSEVLMSLAQKESHFAHRATLRGRSESTTIQGRWIRAKDTAEILLLIWIEDEEELLRTREMSERFMRDVNTAALTSIIGHDINNHLAVMLGNVELVPMLLRKGDTEKALTKLTSIKAAVERLEQFAASLTEPKIPDGNAEPLDVGAAMSRVARFVRQDPRWKDVTVRYITGGDIPPIVLIRAQLELVLRHLILNGCEAALLSGANSHWVELRAHCVRSVNESVVQVYVSDSGSGVDTEHLDKLFQTRFTTRRDGKGKGLLLVRKIVEEHFLGRVGYERMDGASQFSITIPITSETAYRSSDDSGR